MNGSPITNGCVVAIIPVYNPESGLLPLCEKLRKRKELTTLIVVNDGSTDNLDRFDRLPSDTILLCHDKNKGKGEAIKTALRFVDESKPEIKGVVLADGDGQHLPEDIVAVATRMIETNRVVFGVRNFASHDIPFRSRFGNKITAFIIRFFLGQRLSDTQTGLRAFPRRLLSALITLPGRRYEYEMQMLGLFKGLNEIIEQIPIKTVYLEQNSSSHFRPFTDSVVIYASLFRYGFSRMLRFAFSGVMAFLVDNIMFSALIYVIGKFGSGRSIVIFLSLSVARVISATFNFCCNRKYVFKSKASAVVSFPKYCILVVVIAFLSWVGTSVFSNIMDLHGLSITIVKIIVEGFLFFLSYKMQSKWVFISERNSNEA